MDRRGRKRHWWTPIWTSDIRVSFLAREPLHDKIWVWLAVPAFAYALPFGEGRSGSVLWAVIGCGLLLVRVVILLEAIAERLWREELVPREQEALREKLEEQVERLRSPIARNDPDDP